MGVYSLVANKNLRRLCRPDTTMDGPHRTASDPVQSVVMSADALPTRINRIGYVVSNDLAKVSLESIRIS